MKKVVIIACLAFMSLASCSNQNKDVEQPIRTVSVETTTEAEILPDTQPTTECEPLYKDDNFTFTFSDYKALKTVQHFLYSVDNHSENTLYLDINNFYINDIEMDSASLTTLKPHESATDNCYVMLNSELQDKGITRVNELKFKLHVVIGNPENGDTLDSYNTDIITITR